MKPGARTRPRALMVRSPLRGVRSPTAAMRSPSTRTAARRPGVPVPSITSAFVMRKLACAGVGPGDDGAQASPTTERARLRYVNRRGIGLLVMREEWRSPATGYDDVREDPSLRSG